MKIAITADGPSKEASVDPRFGRCKYFIFADSETDDFESEENNSMSAGHGAGISTSQAIVAKGVDVVLTGNCGPNAYQVLDAAGIKVITGVSGKVEDAIKDFKSGKLEASSKPNVVSHFGMS